MASPPSIPLPKPGNVNLRHPMPDLQSLQGAYVGNIERLEEHAERMSEAGSDLGEEIRKTYSELKRSDSRRSVDDAARPWSSRSRNVSLSSHANSIVDVNGTARWGGYSPGGFITSPVGSLRSGNGGMPSTSIQRQRSSSKASRLAQIVHTEDEEGESGRLAADPGSPQSLRSAPLALHNPESTPPEDQRKVSSFSRIYDEIANELPDHLRNSIILGEPSDQINQSHPHQPNYQYHPHHDFQDRPPTAASTDTTHQARTLWQDFDGIHCPDTVYEDEAMQQTSNRPRRASNLSVMNRASQHLAPPMGVPPPDDGMVFYPAPVPKMLNLPKRLSQMPSTNVQARRRTQLLESMQNENRKSAMLGDVLETPKPNNRKSRLSMLPPQLRASAYFDQPAAAQEFAVKGESAEDTLDSILDASARAPVSAFTDHPFAGHVGNEVYGPEHKPDHKRKSSKMPEIPPTLEQMKRRSSFNVLDTKRNSSGEMLNKLKKRSSSADLNTLVVKDSGSRMSLADELDVNDEHARGPHAEDDLTPTRRSSVDEHDHHDDHYDEHALEDEEEEEVEEEEERPDGEYYGAPTTLLAELQMRKAKQKTRNLNYATLVEQGMMTQHRTLLQMDDEAEKEKQRRLRKKVHLAWEERNEDEDSDDDVPLGMLYKQEGPQKQNNWDQPLGLIAQRELEDSEPLSRRRNRLRGDDPNKPRDLSPNKRGTQYLGPNLEVPRATSPGASSDGDREGETLGERMRRLKDKQMLESALGNDVRKSTISGDFASEMFSKFGGPEEEKKEDHPQPTPSPGIEEPEEETLGQRRARLQAEAALQGVAPPSGPRPGLRHSLSLADVLSANPIDNSNQARKVSEEMLVSHLPKGSLLHQNVVAEEKRKAQRLTQNMGLSADHGTLLRDRSSKDDDDDVPLAAKIQAYKNKMAGVGPQQSMNNNVPGMTFNGQSMMGGNANMSALDLSAQQRASFMPQPGMMGMNNMGMMSTPNLMQQQPMMPMMGMGMGMNMNMGMMGGMQNQNMRTSSMNMNMPMMNMGMGMPMGGQMGGMNGMNMGMGGMQMGMGPGMGMNSLQSPSMVMPPMDPRQREQIDRWMQGIRN